MLGTQEDQAMWVQRVPLELEAPEEPADLTVPMELMGEMEIQATLVLMVSR